MGRILVADDDADCLEIVCRVLELEGAEVVRATNGNELLERLDQDEYELVITDVSMPSMTGIEAMRSAREHGCKTPAIVMTARQDSLMEEDIAALGDDILFLAKPFHLDDLDAAVAKLTERSRARLDDQRCSADEPPEVSPLPITGAPKNTRCEPPLRS